MPTTAFGSDQLISSNLRSSLLWATAIVAAPLCLLLGATQKAEARTEMCPAVIGWAPGIPASIDGRSSSLAFELSAYAPRTIVAAAVVADTDGGWYTWDVENVALSQQKDWARSDWLAVYFPKPVFVRHAWVVKARTSGDALYGWDSLGEVACSLPSFRSASYGVQKSRVIEGVKHVTATPIAPLYSTNCAHPFVQATVTHPVQPRYPQFVIKSAEYTAEVEVIVGDHDNLIAVWVYKSSTNPAIDESALAAARASSYQSAVSYCQTAMGSYLFRADFRPY